MDGYNSTYSGACGNFRKVTLVQKNSFNVEFKAHFPVGRTDPTKVPDHLELTTFKQRPDESLQAYEVRA